MRTWAKLDGNNLLNPPREDFFVTKILNGIPSFSYTIQNTAANRALLAANLTDDFKIFSKYGIKQILNENIGTGDGIEVTFNFSLVNNFVKAGSVSITDTVETFTDNGDGILTGSAGGSGTITYSSGEGLVTFFVAPTNGQAITVNYDYYVPILTGSIDCDAIEYLNKHRIRLSGYASFVDLSYELFKRLSDPIGTEQDADMVYDLDASVPTWRDEVNDAKSATIDDVALTFGAVNDAFYIGKNETFSVIKIKYSAKGVQAANTTVVKEYWNGSAWVALDTKEEITYIDESRDFTKNAGTHYLILSGKPSDWVKTTPADIVGCPDIEDRYWIRFRITAGSYPVTQPLLDRIWIGDTDVLRVQFDNIAADVILGYVLEGTEYSEDVGDSCPSNLISIRGEYESKLRWVAAIAKALTHGTDEKKPYDWWITTSDKKVHFSSERGSGGGTFPFTFPIIFGGVKGISADITMLDNREGYGGLANRIYGLGSFDGVNQRRAIVENQASQDSYDLREIYLKDMRYSHETSLKELIQKGLTDSKVPLKEVACEITTQYWVESELEVGNTVLINQPKWNVSDQTYRIMRAVIGPSRTRLDLGISQTHLEDVRAGLQGQQDINDVWMHGATNIYQVGPLLDNFERVNSGTVYPLTLNIYIPDEAKYINKVKLNWRLDNFRVGSKTTADESSHTHSITGKATADESSHTHGFIGKVTGIQSGNWKAITQISSLTNKYCAVKDHKHPRGTHKHYIHIHDSVGDPDYPIGLNAGAASDLKCDWGVGGDFVSTKTDGDGNTGIENEAHVTAHYVNTFTNEYFLYGDHNHSLNAVITDTGSAHSHTITGIATDAGSAHSHGIGYGMQEDADTSPIMELKVNGTTISDNYSGNQHDISITDHVSSGWNTIILQPKTGENKRGRAQLDGIVQVFIESK